MFNDLQAEPTLRDRYQFWVYFYPTADPYLATAADLRKRLNQLRNDLDPQHRDSALDRMVVVGHSMGGLISKLLTVDGGDEYWKLVSDGPFDQVKSRPEVHEELLETFYFKRRPDVSRSDLSRHAASRLEIEPVFPRPRVVALCSVAANAARRRQ